MSTVSDGDPVVPPWTPHKFAKAGRERLEMIDIHASPTFVTEWLE